MSNPCAYCSLIVCQQCILLNKPCHLIDNNRAVCTLHSKNFRILDIDPLRIIVSNGTLSAKHQNIYTDYCSNNKCNIPLFSNFYQDYNKNAFYSDIFDYNDTDLWKTSLPFSGIYLFISVEAAQKALSYFPNLVSVLNLNDPNYTTLNYDGKINYQLCYQCNNYQAKFPSSRTLRITNSNDSDAPQNLLAKNFSPNFYSDNLCRKSNNSHEKKKKTNNKKPTKNEQSSIVIQTIPPEPKYNPPILQAPAIFQPTQSNIIPLDGISSQKKTLPPLPPLSSFASDLFTSSAHKPGARNANISESFSRERSSSLAFWQDSMTSMMRKASYSSFGHRNSVFEMINMPQNIVDLLNSCARETKGMRKNSIILLPTNSTTELHYEPNKSISAFKTVLNSPISQSILNKRKRDDEADDKAALELFEVGDFYGFRKHSEEFPIVFTVSDFFKYLFKDFIKSPIEFTRCELLKTYLSYLELIDLDYSGATPPMPINNGIKMTSHELYVYQLPQVSNEFTSLANLHLRLDTNYFENSIFDIVNRDKVVNTLNNSLNDVSELFSSIDSKMSQAEPVFYIVNKFMNLFYSDFGKFDFTCINENFDSFSNSFWNLILEGYLFYESLINTGGKVECLILLKNLILLSLHYYSTLMDRARLLDLRSRATLQILKAHKDNKTQSEVPNLLDQILAIPDIESLLKRHVVSDDFMWIKNADFLQYLAVVSFESTSKFSLDFVNFGSKCICHVLGRLCSCDAKLDSSSVDKKINFCLPYMSRSIFLEFGLSSLEEYFSKLYILHMNKLQFGHEFMPVDVLITTNPITVPAVTTENLVSFSDFNNPDDNLLSLKHHPVHSDFFYNCLKITSGIDGSKIVTPTSQQVLSIRKSMPASNINYLNAESTYGESVTWSKLAVQLAYFSKDYNAVIQSSAFLIRTYLYAGHDYVNAIDEIEKFIIFGFEALLSLPRIPKNFFARRNWQANIIRYRSILIQYKKHISSNIKSLFFPGEVISVNIDGKSQKAIYASFELLARPIYITHIESIGDCWSLIGCDISLSKSWRPICYDNISMQFNSSVSSLMSQRFVLHSIRTGAYSVNQYLEDINDRNKSPI